jgi:tetratricopeptide (TPR) repeat protein
MADSPAQSAGAAQPHDTAQGQPPAGPGNEPSKSFFKSSQALVLGGLVVLVLSAACALAVQIGMKGTVFTSEAVRLAVTYALYLPSVLLGVLGLCLMLGGSVRWAVYGRDATGPDRDSQERQLALLQSINDRMLLSETAKRLTYRHEDITALRQTVEADINKGYYDAALVLVNEMAENYGLREEAEEFRERITATRQTEMDARVDQSINRLNDMLNRHQFDAAMREAAKIQRLHPDSQRTAGLTRRVSEAREQYKQDLERRFLEAAERDDVDRAMELLKELDTYLTEQEAEPFRETARGVIGKKRDNLGVQFKLAVQDKEWQKAVRVGEQIIREFPNTRMGDEVRGMIDALRQRAGEQQRVAEVSQPAPNRQPATEPAGSQVGEQPDNA